MDFTEAVINLTGDANGRFWDRVRQWLARAIALEAIGWK